MDKEGRAEKAGESHQRLGWNVVFRCSTISEQLSVSHPLVVPTMQEARRQARRQEEESV
jgi:hypothetical protein